MDNTGKEIRKGLVDLRKENRRSMVEKQELISVPRVSWHSTGEDYATVYEKRYNKCGRCGDP